MDQMGRLWFSDTGKRAGLMVSTVSSCPLYKCNYTRNAARQLWTRSELKKKHRRVHTGPQGRSVRPPPAFTASARKTGWRPTWFGTPLRTTAAPPLPGRTGWLAGARCYSTGTRPSSAPHSCRRRLGRGRGFSETDLPQGDTPVI